MLKSKLETLPMQPGCYLMKDKNNQVIYVGKAKKLKNRVNSYFTGTHNNKTTKLVSNIADFDYIVTMSEKEALILEYNLIKQYKPRFNILMMDDASYPYIRITKEKYPTVQLVRDKKKMKNALYFGPYPNVTYARNLLSLIEKLYPLRKCKTMHEKVCLYYHIGLCLGPCEYEIAAKEYQNMVDGIISFINGDTKEIVKKITLQRDEFSQNLNFEKAQEKQELLNAISEITDNQYMQNNKTKQSYDVFTYYVDNGYISICGLLYNNSKLLHKHLTIQPLYDDVQETFISYLLQYYNTNPSPKILIIDKDVDVALLQEALQLNVLQPMRGEKKKLLEVSLKNAKTNLQQKFAILNKEDINRSEALKQLKELIDCETGWIELYDISHTAGSNAVGAQVVYRDGVEDKKAYRTYKVSNGNNDFENMKEILYRRLYRAIKETKPMPDIIIVDGGESQIRAATSILQTLQIKTVKLLGLQKNDKHQTSELVSENLEIISIDKNSELFFFLTVMQDEVHRFAINFHKRLRLKTMEQSQLLEINGIGVALENKLLKKFKNIHAIKHANLQQLQQVIGEVKGKNVYDYFHQENKYDTILKNENSSNE